jgi:hypothetical protein
MNVDAMITILLCVFVFTLLYFICVKCKKMDRQNRHMRRNTVTPTIEIDIDFTFEKENAVRISQNV